MTVITSEAGTETGDVTVTVVPPGFQKDRQKYGKHLLT